MELPRKITYIWIDKIRQKSFGYILGVLLFFYILVNVIFAVFYYWMGALHDSCFLDYLYFSFITSLTIGYGDLTPVNDLAKLTVILHSTLYAVYSALMMSMLTTNLLCPKEAVVFSKNIVYNPDSGQMLFRMINISSAPIINPEVRISVTEHNVGNVIARIFPVTTAYTIDYLGKHDFTYCFNTFHPITQDENFNVWSEWQKALQHNRQTGDSVPRSRFRINITVSGSNGIQTIAVHKKYHADEITDGIRFQPIEYTQEDQRRRGMRYHKIPNFWDDFNRIVGFTPFP
ncbi:MAG: potassium channel family protein [Lachnospiraceae bacterium]